VFQSYTSPMKRRETGTARRKGITMEHGWSVQQKRDTIALAFPDQLARVRRAKATARTTDHVVVQAQEAWQQIWARMCVETTWWYTGASGPDHDMIYHVAAVFGVPAEMLRVGRMTNGVDASTIVR